MDVVLHEGGGEVFHVVEVSIGGALEGATTQAEVIEVVTVVVLEVTPLIEANSYK